MRKERNLLKLLSDDQCLFASKKAFLIAGLHKESAETLAKEGNYGIPVSHLILSTEQTIIGILLYLQHLGIDVRSVHGVHMFFTDHVIKHKLASLISWFYPIFKLMIGFVQKEKEKLHNPSNDIQYTVDEAAITSGDEKRIRCIFKDLPEMLDWWDNANLQKNKGFYMNYSDCLETPMEVNELEYKQAFFIVDTFQKAIFDTLQYLEKASEVDKQEIRKNSKKYHIDKILSPIIGVRKMELNAKS